MNNASSINEWDTGIDREILRRVKNWGVSKHWNFLFTRTQSSPRKETSVSSWASILPPDVLIIKSNLAIDQGAGPFAPFLSIIHQEFEKFTLSQKETLINRLALYPMHRSWMTAWLPGKEFDRWDDVLRIGDELTFERDLIHRLLYDLLTQIWISKKVVFVLESLEQAPPASFPSSSGA